MISVKTNHFYANFLTLSESYVLFPMQLLWNSFTTDFNILVSSTNSSNFHE